MFFEINPAVSNVVRATLTVLAIAGLPLWVATAVADDPPDDKTALDALGKVVGAMTPGVWYELPDSSIHSVLVKRSEVDAVTWGAWGSTGMIEAWNGAAFDGSRLYFWGGGHRAYGGNEVYAFDLSSLAWERLTEPSAINPLAPGQKACSAGYEKDNEGRQTAPTAAHSYDGLVYSPRDHALYLWGDADYCWKGRGGGAGSRNWRFDIEKRTWQRISLPWKRGFAKTALNPETGNPVVFFRDEYRELDVVGSRFIDGGGIGRNTGDGVATVDLDRKQIVMLDGDGIYVFAAGGRGHGRLVRRANQVPLRGVALKKAGIAYDNRRKKLVLWDGARGIYDLDPADWSTDWYPNNEGAGPTHGRSRGVYSKWVYVPQHDVFVGYNNTAQGVWLYRMPDKSKAYTPPPPKEPLYQGDLRVCPRQSYHTKWCTTSSLAQAVQRAKPGQTVVIAPGIYYQAAKVSVPDITIRAEPGAVLKGNAYGGKAALVVTANGVTIDGLECTDIHVGDRNGACVRLESGSLTLRNVYFRNSDNGFLGGESGGTLTIENSIFERNGLGGQAHGLYVSNRVDRFVFRNNRILRTRGSGHGLKTGAKSALIENNVIASLDGQDSRAIDAYAGGELVIRGNVLEKGPNSENYDMIGIARESKRAHKAPHATVIERNLLVFDNAIGKVMTSSSPGEIVFTDNTIVGLERSATTIGAKVADGGGNRFLKDRRAAGFPPYPNLPKLADGKER